MKNIYNYIFSVIVLGTAAVFNVAVADDGLDAIKLYKTTTQVGNTDMYTITLSSFVTGSVNVTTKSQPVDIVLVLDCSYSMVSTRMTNYSYSPLASAAYSYNNIGTNSSYKLGDSYYLVSRLAEPVSYYLTSGNPGVVFGNTVTSDSDAIFRGTLYTRKNNGSFNSVIKNSATSYFKATDFSRTTYYREQNTNSRVTLNTNTNYYLTFTDGVRTYYLNGTGEPTTTKPTPAQTSQTENIWTGVLYSRSAQGTQTLLDVLKTAVNGFISSVAANALQDPDNPVDHRIAIVKYSADDTTNSKVVSGFTDVSLAGNAESLRTTVSALTNGNGTYSNRGMALAEGLFSPEQGYTLSDDRSRVVVMFTDGEPAGMTSSTMANHTYTVANEAIMSAKRMKSNGTTVYTIGVFGDGVLSDTYTYMNYMSSNYPNAERVNPGSEIPGANPLPEAEQVYFQTASDVSSLENIFQSIASASTADTYKLTDTSSSVVDVMSNDFELPEGFDASSISCTVKYCIGKADDGVGSDGDGYIWQTAVPTGSYANPAPVASVLEGNKVKVTNFYYSLDENADAEELPSDWATQNAEYGNFVAQRPDGTWAGAKLVIQFNVKLKNDSQGGYYLPSNDITSGIYVDDGDPSTPPIPVKLYPLPTVDVPAILILKDGLDLLDSSIFDVNKTDASGNVRTTDPVHYRVLLTQGAEESTSNLTPTYAIIKFMTKDYYTVSETSWSWAYDSSTSDITKYVRAPFESVPATQPAEGPLSYLTSDQWTVVQSLPANEQLDKAADFFKAYISSIQDTEGYTGDYYVLNGALFIVYRFNNTPKSGIAKHAEDVVRNIFGAGGGTMEHGGKLPETGWDD